MLSTTISSQIQNPLEGPTILSSLSSMCNCCIVNTRHDDDDQYSRYSSDYSSPFTARAATKTCFCQSTSSSSCDRNDGRTSRSPTTTTSTIATTNTTTSITTDNMDDVVFHDVQNELQELPCRVSDYFQEFMLLLQAQSDEHVQSILNSSNSVGLFYLAKYFQVTVVRDVIWKFIQQDVKNGLLQALSLQHNRNSNKNNKLLTYITDAAHFQDSQTMSLVVYHCASNLLQFETNSSILLALSPQDFYQVVVLAGNNNNNSCNTTDSTTRMSAHTSQVIAAYCSVNVGRISYEWFQSITSELYLPVLSSPETAVRLMEIDLAFRKTSLQESFVKNDMSSLQKRCISLLGSL